MKNKVTFIIFNSSDEIEYGKSEFSGKGFECWSYFAFSKNIFIKQKKNLIILKHFKTGYEFTLQVN